MKDLLLLGIGVILVFFMVQNGLPVLSQNPQSSPPKSSELIKKLKSGCCQTRIEAREAILEVGSPMVPALLEIVNDPDPGVRWNVVHILGLMRDPRTIHPLLDRALKDTDHHVKWRSMAAVRNIDRVSDRVDPIPRLLEALKTKDQQVVWNAAIILGNFYQRKEAIPILMAGLDSSSEFKQWEAVFALGTVHDENTVTALIRLLKEGNQRVRQEVTNSLGRIGDKKALPALLEALKKDLNPGVRWRAALAIKKIGETSVIPRLEEILEEEENNEVVTHIKQALQALRTDKHVTILNEMKEKWVKILNNRGEKVNIQVKVADEPIEWKAGFQYLSKKTIQNTIVLFDFGKQVKVTFHMKNVKAPLDIAFIKDEGTILAVMKMFPGKTGYGIKEDFRYALEAKAGFFENKNIRAKKSRMIVD